MIRTERINSIICIVQCYSIIVIFVVNEIWTEACPIIRVGNVGPVFKVGNKIFKKKAKFKDTEICLQFNAPLRM